jgi:hypothetical protein
MSRWTPRLLAPVAALALLPLSAVAQNVAATPTYGTVNLSAGFTPDPQIRAVTAGGNNFWHFLQEVFNFNPCIMSFLPNRCSLRR